MRKFINGAKDAGALVLLGLLEVGVILGTLLAIGLAIALVAFVAIWAVSQLL